MTTTKDIEPNKEYWDDFYKRSLKHIPSQFCVCVATEIPETAAVVELGSGNGRDSLYFASRGHQTIAVDLSQQAINACNESANEKGFHQMDFHQMDLTDKDSLENLVSSTRKKLTDTNLIFYSRFIIHSLDDEQEDIFLSILSGLMLAKENVYFEFRSKEDASLEKIHKNHFRRYVDTDQFIEKLKNLGFEIDYRITGKGMAKYKNEDPFVSRIFATKI